MNDRTQSPPGEMITLLADLGQPLAAAANYIGSARLLLAGKERDSERAIMFLDCAESQVLRAGEVCRRFRETTG